MKKIWSGAAALAAAVGVICAAMPGAGAEGLTVKYDLRSKSIAVSGYGANSGGRAVNLVLMKKGDEPGAAEPVSVVIAKTGADGNYSADIRLSPQLSPGEYMLYASSAAVSDEAVAIVPDSDAGAEILAQANRAATAAAFSQVVKNGRVQLGLTEEEVGDLAAAFAERPQGGFADQAELVAACRRAYAYSALRSGTRTEMILKKYSDELGISFAKYGQLSDKEKKRVSEILAKSDYGSKKFSVIYDGAVLAARISAAQSWLAARDIILAESGTIGIDTSAGSAYARAADKDAIFKELYAGRDSFSSAEDIKTAFDAAVSHNSARTDTSGGASGGSDSGKKVTVSGYNPTTTTPDSGKSTDYTGHWAEKYITDFIAKGYVKGYEDGSFRPDGKISRAEFLKLAQAMVSLPAAAGTGFSDISPDDWYYDCVTRFEGAGIASGSDGRFCPSDSIIRQDAAVLLFRILNYMGINPQENFDGFNDEISDYARDAVYKMAGAQILSGSGGSFLPRECATRAEAVVMISRALDYAASAGSSAAASVQSAGETRVLSKAKEYLTGLGIDCGFAAEKSVSRAEFVHMAVAISGREQTGGESPFSDVNSATEYSGDIATAYAMGILEGTAEFKPGADIAGNDAVRMLVRLLGFGELAEKSGGYPGGYTKIAQSIGLTKSAGGIGSDAVSGEGAAILLYRALTCGVMSVSDISGGDATYSRSESENLLTENHRLHKVTGVVTATPGCSILADGYAADEGYIMLGTRAYACSEEAYAYIGKNVEIYADDDDRLVIISEEKNRTLTVYEPDSADSARLKYTEDGSKKQVKIDGGASLVYNGRLSKKSAEELVRDCDIHKAELIDNDNDGSYEVIIFTAYKYVKISSYDSKNNRIYAYCGNKSFSAGVQGGSIILTDDGRAISPYDLNEGEYWAIAVSEDGGLVSGKKLTKSILTNFSGRNEEEITTDAGTYKFAAGADTDIAPGMKIRLYFNDAERAAAFESVADGGYEYAYLIRLYNDDENDSLAGKFLMTDGEIHHFRFADKVKIDAGSGRREELEAALYDDGGNVIQQVVRLRLADGKISGIDTPSKPEGEVYSEKKNNDDSLSLYFDRERLQYNHYPRSFPQFKTAGCQAYFAVPADDEGTVYDDEEFKLTDATIFQDGKNYKLSVYDIDNEGCPGAVVVYGYSFDTENSSVLSGLVESVNEGYDEETGEVVHFVRLWVDGAWKKYIVEDRDKLVKETGELLSGGDVVRFTLDKKEKIDDMIIDFNSKLMKAQTVAKNNFGKDRAAIGYNLVSAYKKNGNIIFGSYTKAGSKYDYSLKNLRVFDISSAKIAVYDRETGDVSSGSADDINDYLSSGEENASQMLIRQRYFDCNNLLVIYK